MGQSKAPLAVCALASGSKGNSYWVEAGETSILVDAGLSLRQLSRRINEIGRDIKDVDHVFITHEHKDHRHAVAQILKRHKPTLWATRGTLRAMRDDIPEGAKVRLINGNVEMAGLFEVTTVPVSHDACDPVAYRFDSELGSVAVATDLGFWNDKICNHIAGVDVLVCEANHDPDMLANGPYPWVLKRRIASDRGHLSNAEGAKLALESVKAGTKNVLLAHLSESNNSPSLALDVFMETFSSAGYNIPLTVGDQAEPGPWITVDLDV